MRNKRVLVFAVLLLIAIMSMDLLGQDALGGSEWKADYIVINSDNEVSAEYLSDNQAEKLVKRNDALCVEMDKNVNVNEDAKAEVAPTKCNWALKMINYRRDSFNGTGVRIAIIDSGVDYTSNIEVKKRIDFTKPYEENNKEEYNQNFLFDDSFGHGTTVANIISGKGINGYSQGLSHKSTIYSLKVIEEDKTAKISNIIKAIYWAIENNIDVINMSFGIEKNSTALRQAIKDANDKGIVLVAAVGKSVNGRGEYPARYKEVISVGSINAKGEISDFNPVSKDIDIYAPGEAINAQSNFGEEIITSGTSLSAAFVTGVTGKILSANPNISSQCVRELLVNCSRHIGDKEAPGVVDYYYTLNSQKKFKDIERVEKENHNSIVLNTKEIEDMGVRATARWGKETHQKYSANSAMKEGAYYPDEYDYIKGMTSHPTMHGYSWRTSSTKFGEGSVNYLANYRYLIKVANAVGAGKSYTTIKRSSIKGMTEKDFKELTKILKALTGKKVFKNKSLSNKKAFVMGLAMHTATDSFAHSAFHYVGMASWKRITHPNADKGTVQPKRREMALEVEKHVIDRYKGKRSKVAIIHDFYSKKMNGNYKFAVNKMYSFAKSAGVTDKTVLRGFNTVSKKKSL